LAFDPEKQLQASLPELLERFTPRTIIDRTTLLEQLHCVARDGYSVDAGEYFEDVASVAVPIRDYTRSVVGSLAVAGPCYRIPSDRISQELAPLIIEAGRELSYRLGYNE
jgi:DNA-binding IclR family transcriptional regulator